MKRSAVIVVVAAAVCAINGCSSTQHLEFSSGETSESSSAESIEPYSIAPLYKMLYTFTADDKREFISVLILPGLSDSELLETATALHKFHPHSRIDFYDEENLIPIKRFWKCVRGARPKTRNLTCPDAPDEWITEHRVASLKTYIDERGRTGKVNANWILLGKLGRRIGELGKDD
jgi:hypothetical protein